MVVTDYLDLDNWHFCLPYSGNTWLDSYKWWRKPMYQEITFLTSTRNSVRDNKIKHQQLALVLLLANLVDTKWCESLKRMPHGYSSDSTQWELSNEFRHYRVLMVFKNLCILVLWTKVIYVTSQIAHECRPNSGSAGEPTSIADGGFLQRFDQQATDGPLE